MAKISEILEIEKQRSEQSSWNVIHLFKEGSFYRAYNWSAWLLVTTYQDETPDKKSLTVMRKQLKSSEDDFAFVGIPMKSIDKFIPHRTSFTPINDSQIDVEVELAPTDTALSFESLSESIDQWRQSIPIREDKKKQQSTDAVPQRGITAVMAQVLSYPLESKTPLQNTEFISTLKQQLAALL